MNYVYIGAEKTSTTYIQSLCNKNAKRLAREAGITYLCGQGLMARIVKCCRNGTLPSGGLPEPAADRNLMISEFFYRDLTIPAHIRVFREFLDNFVPEARIVLYVRDQTSWLESFYSTYVKNGKTLEFDAYLDFLMRRRGSLEYGMRAALWEEAFGPRLQVHQFEGQSVLDEMLARFETRTADLDLASGASVNSSLPPATLDLLRSINEILGSMDKDTPGRERARKALKATLVRTPLGQGTIRATPAQRDRIVRRYSETNRALNAQWGTSLPE